MLPLIGLAATYIPDLIKLIAGDKAGTVAAAVSQTVTDITKTTDPAEAMKTLQSDAQAASDLRARLAQIALNAQQAQNDEADRTRQDTLATLQAALGDTKDARGGMVALAAAHSGIAWGAPVVSLVVTIGFFAILALLVFYSRAISADSGATVTQILNISVGTLATGFATVINFWLGSSQGSRSKDTASLQMQATHAAQIGSMIATVKSVTSTNADPSAQTGIATGTVAPATPAAVPPDDFDSCVAVTLAYEGGFADNPTDPGGATNFGITLRTLEAFVGHAVTVNDVRTMSSSTAIEIYRANYWNQMRCGDLPAGVDLMVFDFGVNSGPATSVKALQKLVGVTQDGAIGPITLGAVAQVAPTTLVTGLGQARMAYLRSLASFAEFGDGWTKRVTEVQQKALQMIG
jgi:lysozyme family protein